MGTDTIFLGFQFDWKHLVVQIVEMGTAIEVGLVLVFRSIMMTAECPANTENGMAKRSLKSKLVRF